MNLPSSSSGVPPFRAQRAFTLIELLVVIAIIALLAGLVIPLAGIVAKKKILARARIEINNLDLAINTYKTKKGFYPPDNTTTPAGAFTNQLFYELWGAVMPNPQPQPGNPIFTNTFDNSTIDSKTLTKFFGATGIINSSVDKTEIINFIPTIKPGQIQNINDTGLPPVWVFAITSTGPANGLPVPQGPPPGTPVNVIRYVSSSPTNNPTTFDLWVDVIIGGVTNRVSNWKEDPEKVY